MRKIIIIPAYNEQLNIEKTIRDIRENAPGFDYVVIDDCSVDETRKICEANGIKVISLPVNLGIGGAVQTGYIYAKESGYDLAVQFDGDGQHNARYLKIMSEAMIEHSADMVIGSRFIENKGFQSSRTRRMGIAFLGLLIRVLTGRKITDPTSGMRMINRELIDLFSEEYPKDYPEPESVVQILAKKKTVVEIPVIMNGRSGGSSSISAIDSIYYMIKVTIAILIARIRK